MGTDVITARLHATKDATTDPVILILDTAPTTLIVPDPLGFDVVYRLKSRFVPAATNSADATADYIFDHLA